MAKSAVYTYHCICSELILATFSPFEDLPKRKGDGAAICKVNESDVPAPRAIIPSGATLVDNAPIVIKLEDGFEKRYVARCNRCNLPVGYQLDKDQFSEAHAGPRSDVLYVMSGGLLSTADMEEGKALEARGKHADAD